MTVPSLQIDEIDPHDETAFRSWYDVHAAAVTADRVAPLIESAAAMAASMRDPGPNRRRIAARAVEDGIPVGAVLIELPLREDLDTAVVEIGVVPPRRCRGVGSRLWDWSLARAGGAGRTVLQSEVNVPAGHAFAGWPGATFAAARGFTSENVEDHLVLELPGQLSTRPATEPVAASDGYRIVSWVGACPPEFVEAYAAMWTAMSTDVPSGGMTRSTSVWDADRVRANEARVARTYQSLVSLALAPTGTPAGYTLIYLDRTSTEHALQDDTFVGQKHRGHNLGARLKTANLGQLAEHRGDRRWLHTWTAQSNAAMQAVNARFGFRVVEQLHELERAG